MQSAQTRSLFSNRILWLDGSIWGVGGATVNKDIRIVFGKAKCCGDLASYNNVPTGPNIYYCRFYPRDKGAQLSVAVYASNQSFSLMTTPIANHDSYAVG